ncbi:MAG: HEAT repeat domain-containing protein [Planctomycetes bacterium]|nr:HEAT repeat domain-containing protein [Planctomycetota bacterium]MBI3844668.1 HEAT repeat domain-containing protein [Planctomycetota bacterium]
MKNLRFLAKALVLLLPAAFTGGQVALAHGGAYRGPSGQVPPTGRTPNDPTPPPSPGGGGTPGGGGVPGGITPGGPAAAPHGGTTGGPHTAGGATGGGRGRKASKTEGFERWEFWWAYNREPFLNLKNRLHKGDIQSGSADFLLGKGNREDATTSSRPSQRVVSEKLIPALREALKDSYFDVRAAAVIALGKVGDKSVLPDLITTLADEHKQVSESAALAMGILGEKEATPTLIHLVNDDADGRKLVARPETPFRTRAFAAVALGLLKDEAAIPALLATLDKKESQKDVPIAALVALGIMQANPAVERLTKLAEDSTNVDDLTRSYAVIALGKIGNKDALKCVRNALRDSSLHVSRSAVIALGLLGDADDEQTQVALRGILEKGPDPQGRNWACIALGQIGGKETKKTLLATVEKEHQSLRAFAALGVAIYGKKFKDDSIAEQIRKFMKDDDDQSVRGSMCIALGILEDKAAEKDLASVLEEKNSPDLRGYAAVALGMINARSTQPAIESVLNDSKVADPDLQRSAATALGLMGDSAAVPLLTKLLKEAQSEYVISSSALALGYIGDWRAIDPLVTLVKDKKGTPDLARANAVTALGIIGEDEALPKLHVISINNNYRAQVESIQELLTIL